jgi:hypothetical protein
MMSPPSPTHAFTIERTPGRIRGYMRVDECAYKYAHITSFLLANEAMTTDARAILHCHPRECRFQSACSCVVMIVQPYMPMLPKSGSELDRTSPPHRFGVTRLSAVRGWGRAKPNIERMIKITRRGQSSIITGSMTPRVRPPTWVGFKPARL